MACRLLNLSDTSISIVNLYPNRVFSQQFALQNDLYDPFLVGTLQVTSISVSSFGQRGGKFTDSPEKSPEIHYKVHPSGQALIPSFLTFQILNIVAPGGYFCPS